MATVKQKRAVSKLVGTGGNVTKAMVAAGYSKETAHTPAKLTKSEGFKEALKEFGLTEELIALSLVDDIKAKPKRRVRELELGADILSMRGKDQGGGNKILIINLSGQSAERYGATPSAS